MMSDVGKEGLLSRWSRLKGESRETPVKTGAVTKTGVEGETDPNQTPPSCRADEPTQSDKRAVRAGTVESLPALPSLDDLNPDSDFRAFMDPGVDDVVRRAALKTLFRHPAFNITDGLDVYAQDYSNLEKLTPAMVASLKHARRLLFDDKHDEGEKEGVGAPDERRPQESGRQVTTKSFELQVGAGAAPETVEASLAVGEVAELSAPDCYVDRPQPNLSQPDKATSTEKS